MYNVLIVDDEPRAVSALKKNAGWESCGVSLVFTAMSMKSALQILEQEQIDVLICDIEMPGGNGIQLLENLRERGKQTPCIFVTCHPEYEFMRRAMQLQCADYVLKPIQYDEFNRTLSELIQRMEKPEEADNKTGLTGFTETGHVAGGEQNVEKAVKDYIREHMMENISVTDIAEALHFNPQHLMRVFKKKTGLSVLEYITQVRLDVAKNALENTDLPIREIASIVGYADHAYFTRVFRKELGISPSLYRSRFRD